MLDQRKVDILKSNAEILRDEMVEKYKIAFLGGRYAYSNGDGFGDDNGEFGEEVQAEPEQAVADEQRSEYPPGGVGGTYPVSGQPQPDGF